MKTTPIIIQDTREQRPLPIKGFPVEVATMKTGDYGIKGFSDENNPRFIVERKSIPDLIGSLTSGRERFMREIERMRRFGFRALLIEGTREEIERGKYRSMATSKSIISSLYAITVRAGVQVFYCGEQEDDSIDGVHRDTLIRRLATLIDVPESEARHYYRTLISGGEKRTGGPDGAAECLEGLVRQFVRGVEKDTKRLVDAAKPEVDG